MNKKLRILQLYPKDMNIYGDWGNVLVLKRRAEWHGYETEVLEHDTGDDFPKDIDIVVGGGGQDSGQGRIQDDLQRVAPAIHRLAEKEVPMLVVCGLYQMFGKRFITRQGQEILGIGLFDMETRGGDERLIGNVILQSDEFGEIVGYENHSGLTNLSSSVKPLGTVVRGAGNNLSAGNEGARYKNVIGTYLHGPLLPKNPEIADWILEKACSKKFGDFTSTVIDDRLADSAREIAKTRPR